MKERKCGLKVKGGGNDMTGVGSDPVLFVPALLAGVSLCSFWLSLNQCMRIVLGGWSHYQMTIAQIFFFYR